VSGGVIETELVLIVLAGSDEKPADLPESGAGKHPVTGPKGVAIQLGGRPLIDHLLDRLRQIEEFEAIYIAGPAAAYGAFRGDAEVIDTDGSFGENIQASVEFGMRRHPGASLAFTTCDILPDLDELRSVLADYGEHEPLDFWFPMILAPQRKELGASAWKPQYRIAPTEGAEPVKVLPCHLLIVNPECMRAGFIFRSFELAYRSRNRSVVYRGFFIVTHLLLYLLRKDLRQLAHLRVPGVTMAVIFQAVQISSKLKAGTMTPDELAKRFRMIYVRSRYRRANPGGRGRLPLVEAVSLAKDMDTQEEAEEFGAQLAEQDESDGVGSEEE
jgi:hypothetical protein